MVERATIFGSEAGTYDSVRPGYPDEVIDRIVEGVTGLAVEVGCGTGIASALVAARGVRVLGVEPDARMAALARSRGIDVTISSLEAWPPESCDVMFAAQSWHWVDPAKAPMSQLLRCGPADAGWASGTTSPIRRSRG